MDGWGEEGEDGEEEFGGEGLDVVASWWGRECGGWGGGWFVGCVLVGGWGGDWLPFPGSAFLRREVGTHLFRGGAAVWDSLLDWCDDVTVLMPAGLVRGTGGADSCGWFEYAKRVAALLFHGREAVARPFSRRVTA